MERKVSAACLFFKGWTKWLTIADQKMWRSSPALEKSKKLTPEHVSCVASLRERPPFLANCLSLIGYPCRPSRSPKGRSLRVQADASPRQDTMPTFCVSLFFSPFHNTNIPRINRPGRVCARDDYVLGAALPRHDTFRHRRPRRPGEGLRSCGQV